MIVCVDIKLGHCSLQSPTELPFSKSEQDKCVLAILESGIASEVVLVNTDNRLEIYLETYAPSSLLKSVLQKMDGGFPGPMSIHEGSEAVRHIFQSIATFDPLVIGENQFLDQMECSLEHARELDSIGAELTFLFNRAIAAGKRIKAETEPCNGNVSKNSNPVSVSGNHKITLVSKSTQTFDANELSKTIIREEISSYHNCVSLQKRKNIVKDIHFYFETIRQRELNKLMSLHYGNPEMLEAFSKSLIKKYLHNLFINIQDPKSTIEESIKVRELIIGNNKVKN